MAAVYREQKSSETFDVGVDLGSTVSLNYFDTRPFMFSGKIEKVNVELVADKNQALASQNRFTEGQ
ncbi:hypothetical protein L0244_26085 [bacterium]|nr:hypothetical protein [bacterium]MCI0616465.1 hypothetical protein [bacterium]